MLPIEPQSCDLGIDPNGLESDAEGSRECIGKLSMSNGSNSMMKAFC